MRADQLSGGWSGDRDRGETWAEFDALPLGVKRLYWEAPYQYTAYPAVRRVRVVKDLRAATQQAADKMEADVAREAERLYGPEHPQARGLISGFIR